MFILLEHDNFDKCRKALILSSVMLIVACIFNFNITDVDFYGLKFSASKQECLILGIAGVSYFLWIFFIHTLDIIFDELNLNDELKKKLIEKEKQEDLDQFCGASDPRGDYLRDAGEEAIYEYANKAINKINFLMKRRISWLKFLKVYGGNIIPPYVFSLFSIYKAFGVVLA